MIDAAKSFLTKNFTPLFTGFSLGITIGLFVRQFLFRNILPRIQPPATVISEFILDTADDMSTKNDPNDEYKMVLVIRNDLKMGKGKACAQCSHAAVLAYRQARKSTNLMKKWTDCGQRKVVLKVDSEQELLQIMQNARQNGLISVLIQDAGRTQVESGTKTAIAIGPAKGSAIDRITGHLKLY